VYYTVVDVRLPETRDLFSRRIDFPADRSAVVEAVGDVSLDAPYGDPETIAEVLSRSPVEEFDSADELYDALVSYVGDAYIGRKFYDDRGHAGDSGPEVSF
jgi:hypothetical protein